MQWGRQNETKARNKYRKAEVIYAVAYITAMILLQIILRSAVHLYDFHIFIISSSSFHGFITNQFNDLFPVGLLA